MSIETLTPFTVQRTTLLELLRPQWLELWTRSRSATPFQSPEWLIPWWRHFGSGDPWVISVRVHERLVGLAPLYRIWQPARDRRLLLIGSGCTDCLDVLAEPNEQAEVARVLLGYIAENRTQWDVCDFLELPDSSPLLRAEAPAGVVCETAAQSVCPVLSLPERAENLGQTIPASQLRKLNYYRRRLAREGRVEFDCADTKSFEELFDALLRLHGDRWNMKELPGVLANDVVQQFHRQAALGMLAQNMLRLYGLRLNGRVIASLYGFHCRHRTYYYLGGFDPQLKNLSPGLLIIGHAIDEAVREGSREFDFLRGREAYKYDWGAQDRPNSVLRLHPSGPVRFCNSF